MSDVNFVNLEQLEEWLLGQEPELSQAIAGRSALRVLPAAMSAVDKSFKAMNGGVFLLACFRAVITTGVVVAARPKEAARLQLNAGRSAGAAADAAAYSAARSAAFSAARSVADSTAYSTARTAARSAARSVARSTDTASAPSAGTTTDDAAISDTMLLRNQAPVVVFKEMLWPENNAVQEMVDRWAAFQAREDPDSTWAFWKKWYRGMFEGTPMDWDLQLQVASIDNAVWEKGPEAIAKTIRDIETDWVAGELPQADAVVFDDNGDQFAIVPTVLCAEKIVDTALQQVEFALKIASQSNCGLNTSSVAWLYIEFTLNDCRENASAIEQNFEIAREDIVEGLKNGTYFQDPKLSALERVLDIAVTDLRANHPEVVAAWEQRVQHKLRTANDDQKQLIVEKATELIAVSSPNLGQELALDAKTISTSSGEVQGGAIRRFFGRVAQMRLIVRSSEIVKRIDASSGYKGTRVVQTLHSLVDMIIGLWPF